VTRLQQVEAELAWFERFRATHPELLVCPVRPQDPPEPDLAVETPAGLIGVELTELVTGQFQRSVETAQDGTLHRAEEIFSARGGPPTFVTLYWRHQAGPRRPDPVLADWIATLVRDHLPTSPGESLFDSTDPDGLQMEHPLIERIEITRLAGDPASGWSRRDIGGQGPLAQNSSNAALIPRTRSRQAIQVHMRRSGC
jgi:hypothetical protein